MIELERRNAARFRAALRRCARGRPRGPAPPVVVERTPDGLTLSAALEETALALTLPGAAGPAERLVVPLATIAALEGTDGGAAVLEAADGGVVRCRWQERGEPREIQSEAPPTPRAPSALPAADNLDAVDPSLLAALEACGQTANRAGDTRFALTRLQLRGRDGEVVGTDGHQLLIWGGFGFPFQEDLLVPAVPIFGSRDLAGEQNVRLGRNAGHVVVRAGPWTVWLALDTAARFPDVHRVLPRTSRAARLVLDDVDAEALLRDLREARDPGEDVPAVVLELGPRPAVRWPAHVPGRRGPFSLLRSTAAGPEVRVSLDPRLLARALSLGFREARCASAEAPLLFCDGRRRYLVVNGGPAPAAGPTARPGLPAPGTAAPVPHNGDELVTSDKNSDLPSDPPPGDEALDPLAEAEALRAALAEVGRRAARLVASLRQLQKHRRALHTAWTNLRRLGLGAKEEP